MKELIKTLEYEINELGEFIEHHINQIEIDNELEEMKLLNLVKDYIINNIGITQYVNIIAEISKENK